MGRNSFPDPGDIWNTLVSALTTVMSVGLGNANNVEIQWTLATIVGSVFHTWLMLQAFFDWHRLKIPGIPGWRAVSARWYFLGQLLLCLPRFLYLAVGIIALALPGSPSEYVREFQAVAQTFLLIGEWFSSGAGAAFWMARRALDRGVHERAISYAASKSNGDEWDRSEHEDRSGD